MDEIQLITEKEPSSFKMISTLGLAGFLSGLILVGIYLFTKPYIAENRAKALQDAVFEVLPNTSYFEEMTWDGTAIIPFEDEGEPENGLIYFGYNSEKRFTGVAIPGAANGYQDIIRAIAGYSPDKEVIIGLKVLESKETPGLGDKIILDNDFQMNFKQLMVRPKIEVVKKGKKAAANQIEAITGATISSKAIGRMLQESMDLWKLRIDNHFALSSTQDQNEN